MGKEKERSIIPLLTFLIAIPAAIIAIITIILFISPEPDLKATANGGKWEAPLDVVEKLKVTAQDEASNIESLKTMYAIEVQNNGETKSNRILLEIMDAKYVQYENHGKSGTLKESFRDDKCRVVPMGRLEKDGKIFANAWVISSVTPDGCFKIVQEDHGDVPLYMKTPVGKCAAWVNEYKKSTWGLILLFVCLLFSVVGGIVNKLLSLALRKRTQTPPLTSP